jgi:hypothetical protein
MQRGNMPTRATRSFSLTTHESNGFHFANPSLDVFSPGQSGSDNLLHIMWNSLDPNLQDAFSPAYNKKRRQGGNRIGTKDFFQALVRLGDDSVSALIDLPPPEALTDSIDAAVPRENRLVLEEKPLLSDCVADSLEHFNELRPLHRRE